MHSFLYEQILILRKTYYLLQWFFPKLFHNKKHTFHIPFCCQHSFEDAISKTTATWTIWVQINLRPTQATAIPAVACKWAVLCGLYAPCNILCVLYISLPGMPVYWIMRFDHQKLYCLCSACWFRTRTDFAWRKAAIAEKIIGVSFNSYPIPYISQLTEICKLNKTVTDAGSIYQSKGTDNG